MKKISLKLLFSLLSDSVLFSFHFFHPLWNLKFTVVKSQKKWWALYNKWKIWIDTSWLALYNALRFEKMQRRFISEHTFYINCFTLLIQRCQLLKIKFGWNAIPASQPANYSKSPKWSPGRSENSKSYVALVLDWKVLFGGQTLLDELKYFSSVIYNY